MLSKCLPKTQTSFQTFQEKNTLFDQKFPVHWEAGLQGGDKQTDGQTDRYQTDIATFILNQRRGRFSE